MTSARMASTVLVGAFGAACLLAQVGTGQARLLRGSEPATAKSQPGDDAAGRASLDSGTSNTLTARIPLQKARAPKFSPHWNAHARTGTALLDDPTPTLQLDTVFCTRKAAERYRRIADDGGWAPQSARTRCLGQRC